MPTTRYKPGVAVLDNKIYITGGRYYAGGDIMSSGDCYAPDTNTWSPVADMNIARRGHSLVSLRGRLYAIGGCRQQDGDEVESAEVYDPDNNTWTLLPHKLEGELSDAGACLVRKFMIL